jgi:NCS1 family nucleobase:cation symporter-1
MIPNGSWCFRRAWLGTWALEQQIPADRRHGRARDLFTIWFGSNIMLLTVVTGALATTVYGQPFWPAVLAIVLGNLVGAVFMALHSAQGPRLRVLQMMQTRGQLMTYAAGAVLLLTFIWIVAVHGLPGSFGHHGTPGIAGFMGTVTAAALWQIAYIGSKSASRHSVLPRAPGRW